MLKRLLLVVLSLIVVTAHAQFTPGQILTAAQLNGAFSNVLPVSGGTLTGPLTVPSLSVTGAPIPLASGGTGAATATGATSSIQFLNGNSGSVARAVTSKLQDIVNVLDFGADPTGATDSSTAFLNAAAALGANGGTIRFRGWFLINPAITLPDNVMLVGDGLNGAASAYTAYTNAVFPSALILPSSGGITLGNRNGITDALIINQVFAPGGTYALPFANSTIAAAGVAAYAGTALAQGAHAVDERMENLMFVGFNLAINLNTGSPNSRPYIHHVYGDCTNGIAVSNVADIGRAEDLHFYPFTTANQTWTTPALLLRTGTAYYTGASSTWMKWQDVFSYGWAIGNHVAGSGDVRCIACGADSPTTVSQSNIGFLWDGGVYNSYCIGCGATGQGDAGFRINVTPTNNVGSVQLIAPFAHGNNSANGYVDVQQGMYAITGGFFSDNSSVGQIKIEAGAGQGAITGVNFGNGGTTPIFGTTTSLQSFGNTFQNTTNQPNVFRQPTYVSYSSPVAYLNDTAGSAAASLAFQSNSTTYWNMGKSASNNFVIQRFSSGSLVDTPVAVAISNGLVSFADGISVSGINVLPNLSGTTGSIGGSALAAGACSSGTVAVTNSTNAMAVIATPATYPGDGIFWHGYVSAAGTVTVKVCASIAATPTASVYNVRVLQ